MRRVAAALAIAAALCFLCLPLAACTGQSAFIFFSVRMKGNGDGTITAVAQNEFALGKGISRVQLNIYYSEEYCTDLQEMSLLDSRQTDSLGAFESFELITQARDGYYCAVAEYYAGGKSELLQSETVHYSAQGVRVAAG